MNVPKDGNKWLLKDDWTPDELTETAKTVVPKRLAKEFALAVNAEDCVVNHEEATTPSSWPYTMRCIEFYPDALTWVMQQCQHLRDSDQYPHAVTNAIKVFAMAADIQTDQLFYL